MTNTTESWPFPYPPRKGQSESIEWLKDQQAKYLLLEAPVGTGKSNIGIAYSHYLHQNAIQANGNSFILTPQKILQEQYESSFKDIAKVKLASLYGKSNYVCRNKKHSCEIGSLAGYNCDPCAFKKAKQKAISSPDVVFNYTLALLTFAHTANFKPRKLMVLDECHTLEDHLVNFDAVSVTKWRCDRYNIKFNRQTSIPDAVTWLKEVYCPVISAEVSSLETSCEYIMNKAGSKLTKKEIQKIQEFNELQDHHDSITEITLRTISHLDEHFVLVHTPTSMQFKRLKGAHSFHKLLVPQADRFLFMSSTILDKESFCADLNIPPEDTAFLSLTSDFDKKNRPVYFAPQMKMNAQWEAPNNEKARNNLIVTLKSLLELHQDESGIIHTANFKIADWLVKELNSNATHKIYHHNPDSRIPRKEAIDSFMSSSVPSILISPSCTEGLDLKDDLGRFAIFVKVPFGNLGDQWIKKRLDMSSRWYQRRALTSVIQGGGRVVRTETDKGAVYILDESWSNLMHNAIHMIPEWWKESYIRLD